MIGSNAVEASFLRRRIQAGRYVGPVGYDSVPVFEEDPERCHSSSGDPLCALLFTESALSSAASLVEEPGASKIQQSQRGVLSGLSLHSVSYQGQASISKAMDR